MSTTIESTNGVVSRSTIDLSRLPAPTIIEPLSLAEIQKAMTDKFLELMRAEAPDYQLFDSDPAAKIIEVAAYRELLLRQRVNDAAREVLLPFSKGTNLENLASLFGVTRKELPGLDPITRLPNQESDSSLLSRALLSFDEFSTAGTEPSYIAKVKEFSIGLGLSDVKVYNPGKAGTVRVVLLFADHSDTGKKEENRKTILEKLAAPDVKPLTDTLDVVNATLKEIPIKAMLTVESGVDKELVLTDALRQLAAYRSDRYRIGAGVSISGLHAALTIPNVLKVEITSDTKDFEGALETAPLITWDQKKNDIQAQSIALPSSPKSEGGQP